MFSAAIADIEDDDGGGDEDDDDEMDAEQERDYVFNGLLQYSPIEIELNINFKFQSKIVCSRGLVFLA